MTAIWHNDGSGWQVLSTSGFPDEATLHTLVEDAPQMLPLSGTSTLTVVGREVLLGNGYADLIAVEPSGRLCIIEVKLARNSEAKRAVIAQVLTYAAYLRGMDTVTLEHQVLGLHLRQRGYQSLYAAAAETDQTGELEPEQFANGVSESLRQGAFRLVIVLDSAHDELVRLVGYLESVTNALIIDLIAVAAYDVNGTQVLVPQRLDAEYQPTTTAETTFRATSSQGRRSMDSNEFSAAIDRAPEASRPKLRSMLAWALELERDGLAQLAMTFHGDSNWWSLQPRLPQDNVGAVTIWFNATSAYLAAYRSVLERRSPRTLAHLESTLPSLRIGQGNSIAIDDPHIDALLVTLTDAYREAAGRETSTNLP